MEHDIGISFLEETEANRITYLYTNADPEKYLFTQKQLAEIYFEYI